MVTHLLNLAELRAIAWTPPTSGYLFGIGFGRAIAGGAALGSVYGFLVLLVLQVSSIDPAGIAGALAFAAVFGGGLGSVGGMIAGMLLAPLVARLVTTKCARRHDVATVADRAFISGIVAASLLFTVPLATIGAFSAMARPGYFVPVSIAILYGGFVARGVVYAGARQHLKDPSA